MEESSPKRKCKNCGYTWPYKGQRKYFCCPNCMRSAQHPLDAAPQQ